MSDAPAGPVALSYVLRYEPASPLERPTADQLQAAFEAHRRWAETDGREGRRAQFFRADLRKLRPAEIVRLPSASFVESDLSHTNLSQADLSKGEFRGATLFRADLWGADMAGALLQDAKLPEANLTEANLTGANLSRADLSGAKLADANLSHAVLAGADLTGASLRETNLADADLRHVRGLRLDQTFIRNARFSPVSNTLFRFFGNALLRVWPPAAEKLRPRHNDPWSVLRQSYAGPRATYLFIGLVLFALPYVSRVLFWSAVGQAEKVLISAAERARAGLPADRRDALPRREQINELMGFHAEERPVWQLLVRADQGPRHVVLAGTLVGYNVCVFLLVSRVGRLRDEEERSGYSPAWADYRNLTWVHRLATVLFYVSLASFVWNCWAVLNNPVFVPKRG